MLLQSKTLPICLEGLALTSPCSVWIWRCQIIRLWGRGAETLASPPQRHGLTPVYLLVDSIALKLCVSGEWLQEKHGTHPPVLAQAAHRGGRRRGRIFAAVLTTSDVDDASLVGALLDRGVRSPRSRRMAHMTGIPSTASSPGARPQQP